MERRYVAKTVDEYLASVPEVQRAVLEQIRRVILDAIPNSEEYIGYGVPIFDYRKHGLVGISVAEEFCSFHLMSPPLARELKEQLHEGDLVGATLYFTPDKPVSEATVRLVVARRMAEIDARTTARAR